MSILKARADSEVTLDQVQERLQSGEVLLTYVLAEPRSYCLVVSDERSRIVPLAAKGEIDARVAGYRKAVQSQQAATAAAQALYRLLLDPVSEAGAARRMIIIRDGQLHLIPFDALVNSAGACVIPETDTVQYAPSATAYYLLSQSSSDREASSTDIAALAVGGIPYSSSNLAAGVVTRGYNASFTNLPSSAGEVSVVQKTFGPRWTKVVTGSRATETALRRLDLDRYDVIHLAVHGLSNTTYPDRAALVLLSEKAAGDDGFLQLPEFVQMKLDAKLVVLSACESAVGAPQGQEGISNLSRAFLLAGARTVVSSLWDVDNKSSLYLMRRFYNGIAKGKSFGLALTGAKREMLRDVHAGGSRLGESVGHGV